MKATEQYFPEVLFIMVTINDNNFYLYSHLLKNKLQQ